MVRHCSRPGVRVPWQSEDRGAVSPKAGWRFRRRSGSAVKRTKGHSPPGGRVVRAVTHPARAAGRISVVSIAVRGAERRSGRRAAERGQGSSLCGVIVVMRPECRDPIGSPGAELRERPLSLPEGAGPELGLEEGTLCLGPEARPELATVR